MSAGKTDNKFQQKLEQSYSSSFRTWNIHGRDFFQKQKIILGNNYVVIPIPRGMFVSNAAYFDDINEGDADSNMYAIILQYWLFVMWVLRARIMDSGVLEGNIPVNMYLYPVRDKNGVTLDYLLFIDFKDPDIFKPAEAKGKESNTQKKIQPIDYDEEIQEGEDEDEEDEEDGEGGGGRKKQKAKKNKKNQKPAAAPETVEPVCINLVDVYLGAARSQTKTIKLNGVFIDGVVDEKDSKTTKAVDEFDRDRKKMGKYNLYKCIHNIASLDAIKSLIMNSAPSSTTDETDPRNVFNIYTALQHLTRGLDSVDEYRTLKYWTTENGNVILDASEKNPFYKISPFLWFPAYFCCKIFPCLQTDKRQTAWRLEMRLLAARIDRRNRKTDECNKADAAAIAEARLTGSKDRIIGRDAKTEFEREERERAQKLGFVLPSERQHEYTYEQRKGIMEELGFVGSNERDFGTTDTLYSLKNTWQVHSSIIDEAYFDDPKTRNREKNKLRDMMTTRYITECTCVNTTVSRTAQKLRQYQESNGLKLLSGEVVISDTSLSPMANFLISMNNGFAHHMDVTFHGPVCTTLWIGFGDMFRREPDLHFHAVMIGDAAGGKSNVASVVKEVLLHTTAVDKDSESRQSNAVPESIFDAFEYEDEVNYGKYYKAGDNHDGEKKALMTKGTVTRRVLEFSDDKKKKRVQNDITFSWCGSMLGSTNLGETQLISAVKKADSSSATALASRVNFIHIAGVESNQRSVIMSMSKSMFKTSKDAAARRKFVDTNIMYHIRRMDYWHMASMGWVEKPDMTAFDTLFPMYSALIKKAGLPCNNNRVATKMKEFCRQLVVQHALINHFFIKGVSKHFLTPEKIKKGQFYTPHQMLDIVPVCMEEDVVFSFSVFFSNFLPRDATAVIRVMRDMLVECVRLKKANIVFADPNVAFSAPSDNRQVVNELGAQACIGDEDSSEINEQAHRYYYGGDGSRKRDRRESNDDDKTVSYVLFVGLGKNDFINLLHMRCKQLTIQPSEDGIGTAIKRFHSMSIMTSQYKCMGAGNFPQPTDADKIQEQGIQFTNKGTYVNYELLRTGGANVTDVMAEPLNTLDEMCHRILSAVHNHKFALNRRMLSGLLDEQFPWIYRDFEIKRNEKNDLMGLNPGYLSKCMLVTTTGEYDPDSMAEVQKKEFVCYNTDLDLLSLRNFYKRACPDEHIDDAILMVNHPVVIAYQTKVAVLEDMLVNSRRKVISYPSDYIKECKDLEKVITDKKNTDGMIYYQDQTEKSPTAIPGMNRGQLTLNSLQSFCDYSNSSVTDMNSPITLSRTLLTNEDTCDAADFRTADIVKQIEETSKRLESLRIARFEVEDNEVANRMTIEDNVVYDDNAMNVDNEETGSPLSDEINDMSHFAQQLQEDDGSGVGLVFERTIKKTKTDNPF